MATIFQTFSNGLFFNQNILILMKISLKFVPRGLINNIPALVSATPGQHHTIIWTNDGYFTDAYMCHSASVSWIMAWFHQATSHYLSQYWPISMSPYGITRPQWVNLVNYTPAQRSWRGGILDSPCPSVCLSVRQSVCRRHGFRSISQVCFEISISNFICILMVAIGRSLLIFSDVTFKIFAWQPYWIFWFPDSNFTLALNINFKLQRHNTYVYG